MKHLWTKLNSKPKEWRRIFKALHAMEFLIKNGAPRTVQDIKDDLFKIRALQDFSYNENGTDRGQGVRDKSRAICEVLSDPQKLQEERDFARKTRDKFMGISSTGATTGYMNSSQAAAPASGKYGGFGSEDIDKCGYKPGYFNAPYDPFSKGQSIPTGPEDNKKKSEHQHEKKKKHSKKKKRHDSDSDDDKDEDSSDDSKSSSSESDSDSDKDKKHKKNKKKASDKKAQGLAQVPKANRNIEGTQSEQKQQPQPTTQQQPSLIDLLDTPPQSKETTQSNGGDFFFMQTNPVQQQQPAQTQNRTTDLFSQLNMNQSNPTQQFNPVFGLSTVPTNQTMNNNFGFMTTQPPQQMQPKQDPFSAFIGSTQTQPQQSQPQNLFANLNLNSQTNTTPQQQDPFSMFMSSQGPSQPSQFQQQQPNQFGSSNGPSQPSMTTQAQQQQKQSNNSWLQPKPNDVWSEGSNLFDLNNLKQGDKSILESAKINQNIEKGNNLLHTKDEDLDKIWHQSPQKFGMQGNQNMGNGISSFNSTNSAPKFIPNINPNALFQQQQQHPQMFNPMMGGGNMGFQGQQYPQQMYNPMMGGAQPMGFQPPQFYAQNQQQMPMNGMMGQQQPMGFMGQQNAMGQQQQQMRFGNATAPQNNSQGFNFIQIDEKLDQFKKHIQKSKENSMTPRNRLNRNQSIDPREQEFKTRNQRVEKLDILEDNAKDLSRFKRMPGQTAGGGSVDDTQVKLKMKKNPNFGGGAQQQNATYQSSDDDIPIGFSRRKRLSSASSFQKKFEPNNAATNLVNLTRDEDLRPNREKRDTAYAESNAEDINREIMRAKEEEEERIHQETEQMLEMKRQEITQRLREHEETIRQEKEKMYESQQEEHHRHREHKHRDNHHHQQQNQNQQQRQMSFNPSIQLPNNMLYAPQFNQQPMPSYQSTIQPMQYPMQQYAPHNYLAPQMVHNIPQYTNLDIPGHLDQNLKLMQETLQKLKQENSSLKNDLNKKQVLNADLENSLSQFDKDKYQLHAQANLKLKQQVEDMKRKDIELKSRLSSLQANKQYLHGKATTLGLDIDVQDKQEESLSKQILDFNALIREKESYIKQLMNELNGLKSNKEQLSSEQKVLSHKEEFLMNELIFKEDQLNEISMNNDEMKRKIQSGQSQSKYLLAENERLKREFSQLKEENAVLKASTDFVQNEFMGLNEHLNEYEHKLVMSQTSIEQLQRQNQQDKNELSHFNATIANQQKAYEELKNQLQIINERNSRISMQNEMMMLRQQQQQEQLLLQMSSAQRSIPKEEFGVQAQFQEERQQNVIREEVQSESMNETQQSRVVPKNNNRQQTKKENEKQNHESFRDSPPYEEIQRKNKQGDSMMNAMKWDEQDGPHVPNRSDKQIKSPDGDNNDDIREKNKGQAMAGILGWVEEGQVTKPNNIDRRNTAKPINKRGDQEDVNERQRSKSAKRKDQMNDLMKWEEEDTIKDRRIRQSEIVQTQVDRPEKSLSVERKKREGQSMQNVLQWGDDAASPFKDRQIMKEAEESMKWKQRAQPIVTVDLTQPKQEGIDIRNKHYGQQMAGLLSFQEPEKQFQSPNIRSQQELKQNSAPNSKYGAISINIGSSSNPGQQIAKGPQTSSQVNILNIKGQETQYQTPNRSVRQAKTQIQQSTIKAQTAKKVGQDLQKDISSGYSTPKNKNYGEITNQIYEKQINRKENLDKFLLQIQLEKEKLDREIEKIGEHPKTTQQYRRKEEINSELQIIQSNITNIKNKIKQLKP